MSLHLNYVFLKKYPILVLLITIFLVILPVYINLSLKDSKTFYFLINNLIFFYQQGPLLIILQNFYHRILVKNFLN